MEPSRRAPDGTAGCALRVRLPRAGPEGVACYTLPPSGRLARPTSRGDVAQLEEHRVRIAGVRGSSPLISTTSPPSSRVRGTSRADPPGRPDGQRQVDGRSAPLGADRLALSRQRPARGRGQRAARPGAHRRRGRGRAARDRGRGLRAGPDQAHARDHRAGGLARDRRGAPCADPRRRDGGLASGRTGHPAPAHRIRAGPPSRGGLRGLDRRASPPSGPRCSRMSPIW